MDDTTRNATYVALRTVLAQWRKKFKAQEQYRPSKALGFYSLEHAVKSARAQFAIAFAHTRDVRLYVLPLRVFPELTRRVPASLAKKITSKSVVVFKKPPTKGELNAVLYLLIDAYNLVARRSTVAPGLTYNQPLTTKHVFDAICRRVPPNLVTTVGKRVEVVIPAGTRLSAALAKQRTNPTTLVFKSVSWDQLQALERSFKRAR
ncbi:MAG: hypothetical protein ACKV2T_11425 [Kofleriaceae bacterium]